VCIVSGTLGMTENSMRSMSSAQPAPDRAFDRPVRSDCILADFKYSSPRISSVRATVQTGASFIFMNEFREFGMHPFSSWSFYRSCWIENSGWPDEKPSSFVRLWKA
jgi:hypothetical protein